MLQQPEVQAKDVSSIFVSELHPDSPNYYENAALLLAIEAIRYGGDKGKSPYHPLLSALLDTPALFFSADPLDDPQSKQLKEDYNKAYESLLEHLDTFHYTIACHDLCIKLEGYFKAAYNRVKEALPPPSTKVLPPGYQALSVDFTTKGKTLSIPESCYGMNLARIGADGFFEAMATTLNNVAKDYPHLKRRFPFDVRTLRQLCFDFYSKNKEFVNHLNLEAGRVAADYRGILDDTPNGYSLIAGTPDVEGRIICHVLKVYLHTTQICVDDRDNVSGTVDFHVGHRRVTTENTIELLPPDQNNFAYDVNTVADEAPRIIDVSGYRNNCGLFALALSIKLALESNPDLKHRIAHVDFFEKLDEEAIKKTIDVRTGIVGAKLRDFLHQALMGDEQHRQKTKKTFGAFCLSFLLEKPDIKDQQDVIAFFQVSQRELTQLQEDWQALKSTFEASFNNLRALIQDSNITLPNELREHQCRKSLIQIMKSADNQAELTQCLTDLFKGYEENKNPLLGIIRFRKACLRAWHYITQEDATAKERENLSAAIENFFRQELIKFSLSEPDNFKRHILSSACILTPFNVRDGNPQWIFPILGQYKYDIIDTCASLFIELYLKDHWDKIYTAYCKRLQIGGELNTGELEWFESIFNQLNPEVDHQLSVEELECVANLFNINLKVHDFKTGLPDNEEIQPTVVLTNPRRDHWQVVVTKANAIISHETNLGVPEIPTLHIIEEGHCYFPVVKRQPEKPVKLDLEIYALVKKISEQIPEIIREFRQRYCDSLPETAAKGFFVKPGVILKEKQNYETFIKQKKEKFLKKFDIYCAEQLTNSHWSVDSPEGFVDVWFPQVISPAVKVWRVMYEKDQEILKSRVKIVKDLQRSYYKAIAEKVLATGPQGLKNIGIPTTCKGRDRIDIEMFNKMIKKVNMKVVDPMTGDTLALMAARADDQSTYEFFQDNFPEILIQYNKKGLAAGTYAYQASGQGTVRPDPIVVLLINCEKDLRRLHRQCLEEQLLTERLVNSTSLIATVFALPTWFRYANLQSVRTCYALTLQLIEECLMNVLKCRGGNYDDFGSTLLILIDKSRSNTLAGTSLTTLLNTHLQKVRDPKNNCLALQPPQLITTVHTDKKLRELQGQHLADINKLKGEHRTREQQLELQLANTQKELATRNRELAMEREEKNNVKRELLEKKSIIAALEKASESKDKIIEGKDKTIEGKDKTIEGKDKTIEDKDKTIEDKDRVLKDNAKKIREMANQIAKLDEIAKSSSDKTRPAEGANSSSFFNSFQGK